MKKILFPTDFSRSSENAFRYALRLADVLQATVKVVHTVMPPADVDIYGAYANYNSYPVREELKEQMNTFVSHGITQVLEQLQHPPLAECEVVYGTPIYFINEYAKEQKSDFILMGSRGKNKSRIQKLLGSVTAGVVESAETPVIVVPENAGFKSQLTMAYASNLSDADPFEVWRTIKLLNPLIAKVQVIHVQLENESATKVQQKVKEMESFFKEQISIVEFEFYSIPGKNVQIELDHFSTHYKPDIMVMYQPHRSLWNKLFFQSDTKERAMLTQIPLLIQKS